VKQTVNLPAGSTPGDRLWIVVNDNMMARAHSIGLPNNTMQAVMPDTSLTITTPQNQLPNWLAGAAQLKSVEGVDKIDIAKIENVQPVEKDNLNNFKTALKAAKTELREYGEAQELSLRRERALYKLAVDKGSFQTMTPVDSVIAKRTSNEQVTSQSGGTELQNFRMWLNNVASGQEQVSIQRQEDRTLLAQCEQTFKSILTRQQGAGSRIATIQQNMQSMMPAAISTIKNSSLRNSTTNSITELNNELNTIASDNTLYANLDLQSRAVNAIASASTPSTPSTPWTPPDQGADQQPTGPMVTKQDITGVWVASVGVSMLISDTGQQFSWIDSNKVTGNLNASNNQVSVQFGMENWTGNITEFDAMGKASKIVLDNGIFLIRLSDYQPQASATGDYYFDVSGDWVSNVGIKVSIQQTGTTLSWQDSINASGPGKVSIANVTLTVAGQDVPGVISEFDQYGSPSKIMFINGIILTRDVPVVAPSLPAGQYYDVSGQWKTNVGTAVNMSQTGADFKWIDNLNNKGTGRNTDENPYG
jgi:hypothetical protein